MTDEKTKIEKLEERLAKAADTFKEMKVQMESKDQEIEALKARIVELEGNSDADALRTRIAELEDELILNGGVAEEVEGLKVRLDKAKVIFADQKAKITELTTLADEKTKMFEDIQKDLAISEKQASDASARVIELEEAVSEFTSKFNQIREILGNKLNPINL